MVSALLCFVCLLTMYKGMLTLFKILLKYDLYDLIY
jgi:hypothetical protein